MGGARTAEVWMMKKRVIGRMNMDAYYKLLKQKADTEAIVANQQDRVNIRRAALEKEEDLLWEAKKEFRKIEDAINYALKHPGVRMNESLL